MDVTPLIRQGQQIIQSYANGVFKVSGQSYPHSIIVLPEFTRQWDIGGVSMIDDLTADHFKPLTDIADQLDVVLLGSGDVMAFVPPVLRSALKQRGLPIESMDTGAACRTYNVLMAEGRRVACALIPTGQK